MKVVLVKQEDEGGILANALAANTNGTPLSVSGINGGVTAEVQKTGAGTATITLEGCRDTSLASPVWFPIGYYDLGTGAITNTTGAGNATLTRAVGDISITTGAFYHRYQLLDACKWLRCRVTLAAGSFVLNAWADGSPV